MWASAEKSYDTLPPNSYDKLSVIQLYFRSLPADISIFDKWIKEEIGSHTMKKGTEEDLKKLERRIKSEEKKLIVDSGKLPRS